MGFHCIDDNLGFLILAAQLSAELYMGSFHLVVHCLAYVMQQACPLGQTDIQSQLRCQKA